MPNLKSNSNRKAKCAELFNRADREQQSGNLRSAFRLFLAAAKIGDKSSMLNLGYFYDVGVGVRPNRQAALYWYRRAYRRGEAAAACNIGTIYRDTNFHDKALQWFKRAIEMGDDDCNLEVAKYYLEHNEPHRAGPYLDKLCKSDRVSEVTREEAEHLIARVRKSTIR